MAAEFDRVAAAFEARAAGQTGTTQADTQTVISILLEKRAEVLAHTKAGYFIAEWTELNDQVRRLIAADPRYQAIHARRKALRS